MTEKIRNLEEVSEDAQPTIAQQKEFWDWHWANEEERRTKNSWKDRRHQRMVEYLISTGIDHPRILDIGCGSGWYTGDLAEYGYVTGIDLSTGAIARARERFPEVEFLAGNLYEIDLPEKSFDILLAQEVFDHVEDQPRFIDRVADLLVDSGYMVISCVNRFVYERRGEGAFPDQPNAHINKPLTMREFKELVSTRFDVVEACSLIPVGQEGILRIVNSTKIDGILSHFFSRSRVERAKEQLGFGLHNVIMARKKR